MPEDKLRIALVGAGMFGGDVHLRTYSQMARSGLSPWLGRLGLDALARPLAHVEVEVTAIATRSEASCRAAAARFQDLGAAPAVFWGDTPWVDLLDQVKDLDILAIATPDHLHAAPALAALNRGVHVIIEKPMTLDGAEADAIIAAANEQGLLVGLDMHKRYDPDHLHIRDAASKAIGQPLYGYGLLEEPISIPRDVFTAWAKHSDPFSYVGCHWTDLFISMYGVKPVSLHAVAQKKKLLNDLCMDAFDAVQVKVQFDNGMSIDFYNNWIVPDSFEGAVNQESRLVGTDGFIESDTQCRGLRYVSTADGMKTKNTHFTRDVRREDHSDAYVGYGVDSLVLCAAKVAQCKFLGARAGDLRGTYPGPEEGRLSVLIIQAAREVFHRNWRYMSDGRGAPVTAVFGAHGVRVYDPYEGDALIYDKPV